MWSIMLRLINRLKSHKLCLEPMFSTLSLCDNVLNDLKVPRDSLLPPLLLYMPGLWERDGHTDKTISTSVCSSAPKDVISSDWLIWIYSKGKRYSSNQTQPIWKPPTPSGKQDKVIGEARSQGLSWRHEGHDGQAWLLGSMPSSKEILTYGSHGITQTDPQENMYYLCHRKD